MLNCDKGREILSFYENENSLDATVRRRLIAFVVDYFVTNRIKIGTKDCNILADKIVKLFPNEEKVSFMFSNSVII